MSNSKVTYNILDYSGETSRVGFYLPELSPANYAGIVDNTLGGSVGNLRIAMNTLITGSQLRQTVTAETFIGVATLPADPNSQREIKGRFVYRDTVNGELGSFELPTIDLGIVAQQGTDVIDLEEILVAAFVLVFEAEAVSRDGNAVEVISGQVVGRNI